MRFVGRYVMLAALMMLAVPTMSSAHLTGLGRITGSVSDDGGMPIKGVAIRATRTGENGVIEGTTDEKGSWAVNGVSKGEWFVTFQIAGYVPAGAKVTLLAELARIPPISIVLKKVSKS